MTNKRFCSVITIMFFLFVAVLCSVGCDGDKRSDDNTPNPTPNYIFTVTFDSNGGSSVPSQKIEAGGTVTMPDTPTKNSYIFAGWFTDNTTFENAFKFGTDGDKVTQDITLYAQWLEPDTLVAEYALSEVVIGYSKGDNPKYVTQNLTLPTKSGSADISWSSNSSAISANGTVTRQTEDVNVTLTVRANYNGKTSEAKTFELKVIKKRTRNNSSIIAIGIEDASSGDIEVTRNASGNIMEVEGQYVNFNIQNADDALDAVTVIRDELGIKSPDKELEVSVITYDTYGAEYQFQQVYKGVKVFGRSLMTSTNTSGKGDFLHSSFLVSNVLDSADMKINLSASQAEAKATASYSGSVWADTARTELVVYSLESYDNAPVYAYIVRMNGISGGDYVDNSILINAENGALIMSASNICNAHANSFKVPTEANDERGIPVSFDVTYDYNWRLSKLAYFMVDNDAKVAIHKYSHPFLTIDTNPFSIPIYRFTNDSWNEDEDGQHVSAYINMLKIMKWWKKTFNRDFLYDVDKSVKLIVHAKGKKNNAAWKTVDHWIEIGDVDNQNYSFAVASDVLAHETTHAVFQHATGAWWGDSSFVNEAYADIFACLKDYDEYGEQDRIWTLGEDISYDEGHKYLRNISNPSDDSAHTRAKGNVLQDKNLGTYGKSLAISHSAYLMKSKGLSWEELAKVWYKSMYMGLSTTPNFEDVRRCVVWAAMKIGLPAEKLAIIKTAFDEVGIYVQKTNFGTIHGTVTESGDEEVPVKDAQVLAYEKRFKQDGSFMLKMMAKTITADDGTYGVDVEAGYYSVFFYKEGYEIVSHDMSIESSDKVQLDAELKTSNSIRGIVMTSSDKSPLQLVNVKLFAGNSATGTALRSTITGTDGSYFFDLKTSPTGYYKLLFSKDGYKDATLLINVNGGVKAQNIYLSENEGIFGTVYISPDRTPLDGVTVKLWQGSNTSSLPLKTVTTDSSGKYSLSLKEIGAGDYTMTLAKTGYKSVTHNVSVPTGTTVWYNAYLEEEGEEEDIPIDEEHFPDENFREYVKALDTDNSQTLSGQEIALVERINVSNKNISSLKGIEYFTALKYLDCSYNRLTEIEISKNRLLEQLICSNNQLTEINLTANTMLKRLTCTNNMLKGLDVSRNTVLISLECGTTPNSYEYDTQEIMTLDLRNNKALVSVFCRRAGLSLLMLGDNSSLLRLDCEMNTITTLNLSGCTVLEELDCNGNSLQYLNVSNNTALKTLKCSLNEIRTLTLGNKPVLETLYCTFNNITVLDISGCPKLTRYDVERDNSVRIISSSYHSSIISASKAEILAVLHSFTPERTGTYAFSVSLDREPPEGSSLILLDASEDIHGSFADTESPLRVKVSADLTVGRTYVPVIAAQRDDEASSGGCNVGAWSIMICLAGVFFMKK